MISRILPITLLLVTALTLTADEIKQITEKRDQDRVTISVYYFHRSKRCRSCLKAEAMSKEALDRAFPEELKNEIITFHTVAVDGTRKEKKIAKEFGAFGPSLYLLVEKKDAGRRISLDRMWPTMAESDETFKTYLTESIGKYLGGE